MSPSGQTRESPRPNGMSALAPRTDFVRSLRHVRKVPKGDIARLLEMKKPPTEAANIDSPAQQGDTERGAYTELRSGPMAAQCNRNYRSGLSSLPYSILPERWSLDADQRGLRTPIFGGGSFASSSASNFKSISRPSSVCDSAIRFLNRVRFSL